MRSSCLFHSSTNKVTPSIPLIFEGDFVFQNLESLFLANRNLGFNLTEIIKKIKNLCNTKNSMA